MGLSHAAARGAVVSLIGQLARFGIQLAATAILARLLVPSDFGFVAMILAVAGIATVLADFGISLAAIQRTEISVKEESNLFWIATIGGAALSCVVWLSSPLVAGFYGVSLLQSATELVSTVFLAQGAGSLLRARLTRLMRYRALVGIDVFTALAAVSSAVILALTGHGYWALIWQQVVSAYFGLVLLWVISRWRPRLPSRTGTTVELVRFGVNTGFVQLLNYVTSNVDSVALGRTGGSAALGAYNQAFQIFRVPVQQLAQPMTGVAVPVLARLRDSPSYLAYLRRAQLILAYGVGGVFALLAAVAIPLFALYLGPGWEAVPDIFRVLAIGGVFQVLGYVYYWVFVTKNLTSMQLRFSLVTRALMVGLIILGAQFGALGVAAGGSLGLMLNWLALTLFALPRADLPRFTIAAAAVRPVFLYCIAFTVAEICRIVWLGELQMFLQVISIAVVFIIVVGCGLSLKPIRRDIGEIVATVALIGDRGKNE